MELGLKGKKALVTGASSGLGYAIASTLVKEGVEVAIASSNPERIQKAAEKMGAAAFFAADLDQSGMASSLIEKALKALGGLDILIANTAGPKTGSFQELKTYDWEMGFRRLYLSALELIQGALPIMKQQKKGRILLLTSCAAKEPVSRLTISSGLRSGLLAMMKALSSDVAADGITVNSVLPGYVRTEALSHLKLDEEKLKAQIPARRLGEPSEVADLFVFLASDAARYITGQAIACDGGYLRSF